MTKIVAKPGKFLLHKISGRRSLDVINCTLPWITANTSPHSEDNSGGNQTVFYYKWIQIRSCERDNITHDIIATTSEIVRQIDNTLVAKSIA